LLIAGSILFCKGASCLRMAFYSLMVSYYVSILLLGKIYIVGLR
jgi:hypothetical protein